MDLNDPKTKDSIGKVIEYACISGAVEPDEYSINSKYKSDYKGVMRVFNVIRHGKLGIDKEKLD